MSDIKNKTVAIYIDQTAGEVALKKLQVQADGFTTKIEKAKQKQTELRQEIEKLSAAGQSVTKLQKEYDGVTKTITGYEKSLDKVDQKQRQISYQIDRGIAPSLKQQKTLVEQLRREWEQLPVGTEKYIQKLTELTKAEKQLESARKAAKEGNKVQKDWMDEFKGVAFGVAAGGLVQGALQSIPSYISGIINGNAKLSDSLADVSKATGLSDAEVTRLNSSLSKLNTRTPTEQLRQIAIGLGQINEAASPENVAAIDKIVVALGDEFGGDANAITNQLSVLRNNLQDIKTGNYGEDVGHIGNALNVLGASGLATAPVVTDIANRMAGVAETFGLTSGQILGTAATFQELGIEQERGSTAFIKILQKMAAEPEKFAKVAKLAGVATKEDFIKLLNTDMLEAFTKVSEGAKIAGKDNVAFGKILTQLDADGSGAGEVLSKLSSNQELLATKVKLATDALKSQDSITAEFNKKNETLGASLDKLSKRIGSLFSNSALSNFFSSLVRGTNELLAPTKSATEEFDELSKKVQHLDKDILPLANRYDELKSKTILSKTEQAEMKTIISQITGVLPGAATEFDKYGNAIAISTTRVREFITAEQARLKVVNSKDIADNQAKLNSINQQIAAAKKDIDKIGTTGSFDIVETTAGAGGGASYRRKANQEEIAAKQELYRNLISQQLGYQSEIKRLNGDALKEQIDAQQKAAEDAKKPNASVVDPFADDDKTARKAAEILQRLKDFQFELQQVGKQADESEIARITKKYDDLIAEASKYSVRLVTLEAEKNRALAVLLEQEIKKRKEASDKQYKESTAGEYDNQVAQTSLYYEKQKEIQAKALVARTIDEKQYKANLAAIDVEEKNAQIQNAKDYAANVEKAAADVTRFSKEELEKQVADLIAANRKMLADVQLTRQLQNDAAIARINNRINNAPPFSQERLKAEKDLLEEQKRQELEAVDERENAARQAGIVYLNEFNDLRSEINDAYRQAEKAKEIEHYTQLAETSLRYISGIIDIVAQFDQVESQNEQRALDRELKANETKKAEYKHQLNQKLISQQQYQQLVNNLDREAEQKKEALDKKQFERNQRLQTKQALINGAEGVTKAIAEYPFPANLIPIAFAVSTTAAQVAAINAAKFAEGGRVDHPGNGRIQTPSNIPVQPNGDDVLATVKRGEVILNEKQQAAFGGAATFRRIGVPGFSTGGAVKPAYQTRSYQSIDFAGATRSILLVKQFANGGAVTTSGYQEKAQTTDPVLLQTLQQIQEVNLQLAQTNIKLSAKLDEPIQAQANISLKQLDDANNQKNRILQEATFA